jgi:hypothetical protein
VLTIAEYRQNLGTDGNILPSSPNVYPFSFWGTLSFKCKLRLNHGSSGVTEIPLLDIDFGNPLIKAFPLEVKLSK